MRKGVALPPAPPLGIDAALLGAVHARSAPRVWGVLEQGPSRAERENGTLREERACSLSQLLDCAPGRERGSGDGRGGRDGRLGCASACARAARRC